MRPSRHMLAVILAAGTALALGGTATVTASNESSPMAGTVLEGACGTDLGAGFSHCNLFVLGTSAGRPLATSAPVAGYGPADIQAAYALPGATAGAGQTVAIVDAFDDKTAEADLATYRSAYGLPACTTANGCFRKVNQKGVRGSYPTADQGWAVEISLDLDMVSATCPKCHILLVEAKSNTNANLFAAVDTAAHLGATEISNSYGGSESAADTSNDSHFNHPGIAVIASAGDSGYGVQYPASSQYVTAVGGTSLSRASNTRGWTESVWGSATSTQGTGSGCSSNEPKPAWQTDTGPTGCGQRTVADVAAVADPATGVAVYDSNCSRANQNNGTCFKGWGVVGGTSASAPIIAGVYALAGNAASVTYGSYGYAHTAALNDVTSGSNGACAPPYLCTAGTGYDGPTGNGTPNGTGAF